MIVDAGAHYGPSGKERKIYPIAQFLEESAAAGVARIVQVTSMAAGWDNRASLEGVTQYPDRVLGVFGRFDPYAPDLEARLNEFHAQPRMLGVRLNTRTPGGENGLKTGLLDGFFAAAERLDVAVLLYAPFQATEMREAARRFPGIRFLVDHMGLRYDPSGNNREIFRQWPELLELAEEPRVWIKVSYFPEAVMDLEAYPFPTAQGYLRKLYDRVGSEKLVWSAHYPAVKRVCTYPQALDFVRVHCGFLSKNDKDAILGENFLTHFVPGKAAVSS
jgi:predicted TIM-barrel fold metal-dependent hydrolase